MSFKDIWTDICIGRVEREPCTKCRYMELAHYFNLVSMDTVGQRPASMLYEGENPQGHRKNVQNPYLQHLRSGLNTICCRCEAAAPPAVSPVPPDAVCFGISHYIGSSI